jgi:long-chain acyl-CoA synthetase
MASEASAVQQTGSRTAADLAAAAAAKHGGAMAMRFKRDGEWLQLTFDEVAEAVQELARGLVDLGVEAGDRVGILANTRPEWSLASFAISAAGGVVVPVYPTNAPEECEWVLGNSGAVAVVCEDESQLAKVDKVADQLQDLRHRIGIESGVGDTTIDELRRRGRDAESEVGEELSRRTTAVEPGDAYTIVYTSGTTGPPKGVVLTHGNAMSVCDMVEEIDFVKPGDVAYLYLPLAHVFALTVQVGAIDSGTGIVYFGGDTKQIIPEIAESSPTYVPSVPRIFEKLYAMGTAQLEKASAEEREQFEQAVKLGVEVRRRQAAGEEVSAEEQKAFDAADERIFKPVRQLFGGNVRQAVTGAAPIAPEILEFFYAAGVPVLEGYGMTETTGVGAVGTLEHFRFGTVGQALPGVEFRIAEEDGEILMRGPNIFREYWGNPDATAETLIDGWLHTGDLGELDEEGYLKITGRKKDIIITAGGKNLTPSNIENDLKQSRFISQAVMFGDRKPYPVALITLDPEEIAPWAREHGLPEDPGELTDEEHVRELIQKELDRANARYAQVEQIKRFAILDHDLSQETGELTPTLKVKRNVVYERYADLFAELYR